MSPYALLNRTVSRISQNNALYFDSDLLGDKNKIIHKGIAHFEINFWYVLAYLKGLQDVGVFVSAVFSILIFLGQTVFVCHSYNAGLWSPPQRACTEKSRLNMI